MLGAIFDFDGVVIDSCPLHEESWKRVSEELQKPFSREVFLKGVGVKNERFISELLKWTQESAEIAHIMTRKEKIFYELIASDGIGLIEGTVWLIKKLKKRGIPCAIGSSAVLENIDRVFSQHPELESLFDVIVTGGDVSAGKPDPEVFLTAAQKLEIEPGSCVVFEDAPLGIEAARGAGMKSVALTTTFPKQVLQQARPDLLVDSLDDPSVITLFS